MPNFSDLDGTTGERFYILNAAANEGDIAVFDAQQGLHPVPLETVLATILESFTLTMADMLTRLDDLQARVEALENP